jgi:hypothetical protein
VGDAVCNFAQPKFRIACSGFGGLAARSANFAAVQRGWRDFRIAQSSFERADPRCQKIGRRRLSRSRQKNGGGIR